MIEKVIEHFGSQSALARALGVSRQAVSIWIVERGIPATQAIKIEKLTNGKFKAVDLC